MCFRKMKDQSTDLILIYSILYHTSDICLRYRTCNWYQTSSQFPRLHNSSQRHWYLVWFFKLNFFGLIMVKTRCQHLRNFLWNPKTMEKIWHIFGTWILVWEGISRSPGLIRLRHIRMTTALPMNTYINPPV